MISTRAGENAEGIVSYTDISQANLTIPTTPRRTNPRPYNSCYDEYICIDCMCLRKLKMGLR